MGGMISGPHEPVQDWRGDDAVERRVEMEKRKEEEVPTMPGRCHENGAGHDTPRHGKREADAGKVQ